jgi:hypothetical protein
MSVFHNYNVYQEQLARINAEIKDLILVTGYKECHDIVRKFLPTDNDVIVTKLAKIAELPKAPLLIAHTNKGDYEIMLVHSRDFDSLSHVNPISLTIDMTSDVAKAFLAQMNLLESWLLENSRALYRDIQTDLKLNKLIKSLDNDKRRRFSYLYPSCPSHKILFVARCILA